MAKDTQKTENSGKAGGAQAPPRTHHEKVMEFVYSPQARSVDFACFVNTPAQDYSGRKIVLNSRLIRANKAARKKLTSQQQKELDSALVSRALDNDICGVKRLLKSGASVHFHAEPRGFTALMFASAHGSAELAALLISAGADIYAGNIFGQTPLMFAALCNKIEVANVLVNAGADVNARSGGSTAMSIARNNGHTDFVELLKAAGATE